MTLHSFFGLKIGISILIGSVAILTFLDVSRTLDCEEYAAAGSLTSSLLLMLMFHGFYRVKELVVIPGIRDAAFCDEIDAVN